MTRPPGGQPQLTLVSHCPGCQTICYASADWKKMTADERRASGGRERIGQWCSRCYLNPKARDPQPGEEFVEPECPDCGATLVSNGHWQRANADEHAELREEGYKVSDDMVRCRRDRTRHNRSMGSTNV